MKETGNLKQCLEELGYAVVPTVGNSMLPILQEGKCMVQVIRIEGQPLQEGDVVLYRRKNGAYILHRIMRKIEEDTFLVCGDHQWRLEEEIQKEQIIAVMQGFLKNGHYVDDNTWWYRIYKIIWNRNLLIRRCCLAFLRLSGLEKKWLR